MNLHLAEIATQIAPGAHAALLVDQAGWHLSRRLVVPPNITLIIKPGFGGVDVKLGEANTDG
jgi:hypothetical protein